MNEIFLLGVIVVLVALIAVLVARRPAQGSASTDPRMTAASSRAADPRAGRLPDEEIVDRLVEGVVVVDLELRPMLLNRSAKRMLGIRGGARLTRLPSEEVIAIAERVLVAEEEAEELITLWFPERTRLKARVSLIQQADCILILLQDVTEEMMAQQVRREFVAHASHELKSPVAGLQTLAEAVREAVADDPVAAARFSDRLAGEANRLGRLIADLLDLSRLEDPTSVAEEAIDLAGIGRKEIEQVESMVASKGMDLRAAIVREVWIRGDEQQLGLMIRNLLENAIRYTPEGGTVRLEISRSDTTATVSVSDTGIGIPLEAQSRVFERFYRVDKARSRDRGGTGLGLAIVKHVAELHGGSVSLRSELGKGSTFTATLPAVRPDKNAMRSIAG